MKIKNTLNTLNVATGTDLIFEPLEVKELSDTIAAFVLREAEDFEEFIEKVSTSKVSKEIPKETPEEKLEEAPKEAPKETPKTKGVKKNQKK